VLFRSKVEEEIPHLIGIVEDCIFLYFSSFSYLVILDSNCDTSWYYDIANALNWYLDWMVFGARPDTEDHFEIFVEARYESWTRASEKAIKETVEEMRIQYLTEMFNEKYNISKDAWESFDKEKESQELEKVILGEK